jgi:hypothetical protein
VRDIVKAYYDKKSGQKIQQDYVAKDRHVELPRPSPVAPTPAVAHPNPGQDTAQAVPVNVKPNEAR